MSAHIRMEDQLQHWMAESLPSELLLTPLNDENAAYLVELLKQEADKQWFIKPQRSLELAERIIAIGRARNDKSQEAMGLMARGDALRFLVQMKDAWAALEQAGAMFQAVDDEVGWARTRIGLLDLGMKLNQVEKTFADARHARAIFKRYGEHERILRLDFQMAIVYNYLGDQHQALRLFQSVLELAKTLGEPGQKYLGQLYLNIGFTYDALGDFRQALTFYEHARHYMVEANETRNIALLDINIAYIAQAQGYYRRALDMLHKVLGKIADEFPAEALWAKCDMVECLLYLNRYTEARDLAKRVVAEYRINGDAYEYARALLHLTTAYAELGNFAAARKALSKAKGIFDSLDAKRWVMTTHLWRGKIALKQGDAKAAYRQALAAASFFETGGQQVNYAMANLLKGQAEFALGHLERAMEAGKTTLRIAQHHGVSASRYSAHLLLGQIKEAQGKHRRAVRHYQAATAAVERIQRDLTITLRPGFLEDKGEALRALITHYLGVGQTGKAFETLERAKSQVLLGYLANQEQLRWGQHGERSQTLLKKLDQLRAEHQWFSRLISNMPRNAEYTSAITPERALHEIAKRERQMRSVTEQLYLHSAEAGWINPAPTPSLDDIQRTVNEESLLIEFYNDGTHLWSFTLDGQIVDVRCLPMPVHELSQLITKLQTNIAIALRVDPLADYALNLTFLAQNILKRLYSLLIEPLALNRRLKRLVIVPYGALHYLPFHLLYDGSSYLMEKHEIVVLPAAGLATRPSPKRKPGALILAHSLEGRLPQTVPEARMVQKLFNGALYMEGMARRTSLQVVPSQVLHIATHGQHRPDQPDLSYLQLADGQLYTDDLLQQDLSYELVTLSGCETGRTNVASSDELIGIGRGFLYAGAGALIVSLWPVMDDRTLHFMERMYKGLQTGISKAAALRAAQQASLAENRQVHPAFWGAFQLIGDVSPLSL